MSQEIEQLLQDTLFNEDVAWQQLTSSPIATTSTTSSPNTNKHHHNNKHHNDNNNNNDTASNGNMNMIPIRKPAPLFLDTS